MRRAGEANPWFPDARDRSSGLGFKRIMKRRICEWGLIVSLLMTLALAALWADSLLTKRTRDVIFSLGSNLKVLVVEGGCDPLR
jgi:hypothetical protein